MKIIETDNGINNDEQPNEAKEDVIMCLEIQTVFQQKKQGNTITSVDKDEIHEATQYIMNQPDMEDDDSKNMSP